MWKLGGIVVVSCLMGCSILPGDDPFYYYNEDGGNPSYQDHYDYYPYNSDRYYYHRRYNPAYYDSAYFRSKVYYTPKYDDLWFFDPGDGCYYPSPRAEYRARHERRADQIRGFSPRSPEIRYDRRIYENLRVPPKGANTRNSVRVTPPRSCDPFDNELNKPCTRPVPIRNIIQD